MIDIPTFRIGKFLFLDSAENTIWRSQILLNPNMQGLLQLNNWCDIQKRGKVLKEVSNKYRQLQMAQIFYNCHTNFVQIVCLEKNGDFGKNIIKDLAHCQYNKFQSLKQLYLRKNNIQSIDSLQSVDFNSLVHLNLYQNLIWQLKSLRKTQIPKIKIIDLRRNKINEPVSLDQLRCPDLEELKIDRFYQKGQTYHYYLKLQTNKINHFVLSINPKLQTNFKLWEAAVQAIDNKYTIDLTKYYGWIKAKKKPRF